MTIHHTADTAFDTRKPWIGLRLIAAGLQPVKCVLTALRHRREVAVLLQADSGILRDLGLHPADLSSALAEPLWRDPSTHLLESSRERREASRAAARDNIGGLGASTAKAA